MGLFSTLFETGRKVLDRGVRGVRKTLLNYYLQPFLKHKITSDGAISAGFTWNDASMNIKDVELNVDVCTFLVEFSK